MPALSITLNQLAAALLGAGAYIYHVKQAREWKACAVVCGCLIQRSSPDPYAALGAVAQVLIDYEAQQAAQDLVLTPAARTAYKAAWAASEGQPVPARFAAAEAAAAATESADWSQTIRTEQDNARTIQRLRSIAGRASAAEAASGDEQPASDWEHKMMTDDHSDDYEDDGGPTNEDIEYERRDYDDSGHDDDGEEARAFWAEQEDED
jgi:hypothetical protein